MLLGYILCITHLYVWTHMVLACPMSHPHDRAVCFEMLCYLYWYCFK